MTSSSKAMAGAGGSVAEKAGPACDAGCCADGSCAGGSCKCGSCKCGSCKGSACGVGTSCPFIRAMAPLALPIRLGLGGLMAFAGYMKLGLYDFAGPAAALGLPPMALQDIEKFAGSVNGFKLGLPEPAVLAVAYVVPYMELFAGLALVLGWCARAAGLVVALLMAVFIAGIASLMWRGLDLDCTCFGAIKMFCTGPMGACHLVRNGVFALAGLTIWIVGAGWLSVDRLMERRAG